MKKIYVLAAIMVSSKLLHQSHYNNYGGCGVDVRGGRRRRGGGGLTTSSCLCLLLFFVQVDSHTSHSRQKVSKLETTSSIHKREVTSTLQELLDEDYSSVFESSLLSNPWRAVEAYHFFLLVQRLFYSGNFEESLRTVSACTDS